MGLITVDRLAHSQAQARGIHTRELDAAVLCERSAQRGSSSGENSRRVRGYLRAQPKTFEALQVFGQAGIPAP
jgi:hypothetical protein